MGERRPERQQLLSQVDGLNFELLELVDRMNSTLLPPIPDIEEVHFAIDKCQVRISHTGCYVVIVFNIFHVNSVFGCNWLL